MMSLNYRAIDYVLEGKGILYHGTIYDIPDGKIDLKQGRKYTDFGQGFYLTSSRKQAEKRAVNQYKNLNEVYIQVNAKKSKYIQENLIQLGIPVVIPYKIDKNKATKYLNRLSMVGEVPVKGDINIKIFDKISPEWARFVLNNRTPKFNNISSLAYNGDGKYDIVIGPVADGHKMGKILAEYNKIRENKEQELSEEDLQVLASKLMYKDEYNDQYSFHTKDAIKILTKLNPIYLENVNEIYKESNCFDYEEFELFKYSVASIVEDVIFLISKYTSYSKSEVEDLFYNSKTYELLQDINTGLYEEDPYLVIELLRDEIKYGYFVQREF